MEGNLGWGRGTEGEEGGKWRDYGNGGNGEWREGVDRRGLSTLAEKMLGPGKWWKMSWDWKYN